MNLFDKSPFAYEKAFEWAKREEEFVKRAGFVLMARLAQPAQKTSQERIEAFLPVIEREASDRRNFVKKAVNWALREVGKHNLALNAKALETAQRLKQGDAAAARWVANDAIKELTSPQIQERLLYGRGKRKA
jgi:3-methyladenine DNA glycosylase AlkD